MKSFLMNLKEVVKKKSRTKKNEMFYSLMNAPCSILDVGVYCEEGASEDDVETNHFIKQFKFKDEYYTGLGIGSMDTMRKLYPTKKFVQYDGSIFPFKDKEFEFTYSNAVIEHVGSYAQKLTFLKEMSRVSHRVFFTTPNKYFIVDPHTLVFFLHWNRSLFNRWREKYHHWLPLSTLNPVSLKEIKRLLQDAGIKDYKILKNRFLFLTMTYSVIIES